MLKSRTSIDTTASSTWVDVFAHQHIKALMNMANITKDEGILLGVEALHKYQISWASNQTNVKLSREQRGKWKTGVFQCLRKLQDKLDKAHNPGMILNCWGTM